MAVPALEDLEALYPSIPRDALILYLEHYGVEGGEQAWAYVRQDGRYKDWFPGNLTDDGEVRYSEANYSGVLEAYDDVYRSVGLDPKWLAGRYGDLIGGEKSPDEFAAEVALTYDRIVSASEGVRNWYAEHRGIQSTTQALLLAHLDPSLQGPILEGDIELAEIGGTASDFGFDLDLAAVEELVDRDMTKGQAAQLFGQAQSIIPIMQTLLKRHNDPDDEFDVESFIQSEFFMDPLENYRMRRVMAAERALYGSEMSMRRDQRGGVTGLIAQ